MAATSSPTRIAPAAIHPHGVSSSELGVVVEAAPVAVAVWVAVEVSVAVAVWVSVSVSVVPGCVVVSVVVSVVSGWVALVPGDPVVVRVLDSAPDRDPLSELGMELGNELGRPPPPPQPPSSRPTTRAGAAIAHHHDPAERRFGLIGAVHTTFGGARIARTG